MIGSSKRGESCLLHKCQHLPFSRSFNLFIEGMLHDQHIAKASKLRLG